MKNENHNWKGRNEKIMFLQNSNFANFPAFVIGRFHNYPKILGNQLSNLQKEDDKRITVDRGRISENSNLN